MSYSSRVYRQRNAHSHDEAPREPFFRKQHDIANPGKKNAFFQAKLSVNQPGDSYEREADAVAAAVVNRSSQTPVVQQKKISSIQRLSTSMEDEKLGTNEARMLKDKEIQEKPIQRMDAGSEKEEEKKVQKKTEPMKEEDDDMKKAGAVQKKEDGGGSTASTQLSSHIENSTGKGTALPQNTLHEMSSSFGVDFSNVRIHKDSESVNMNKELQSQAFTHGEDIYFNSGKYDPANAEGKLLLAHELTHVIQQKGQEDNLLSRKINVPAANKPALNSTDKTTTQQTILLDYLNKLCDGNNVSISNKEVVLPPDFCVSPAPAKQNPNPLSPAAASKTPVSCNCLCDLTKPTAHTINIIIDDSTAGTTKADNEDAMKPGKGSGSTVTVPSPSGTKSVLPTKSGKKMTVDPFIVLGHELCGHAWLADKGESAKDHTADRGRGGHQAAVERENLIRKEHTIEERATFREPFCGEADDSSFLQECKIWRQEYNRLNGTSFKIGDTIPADPKEEKPAEFRQDIFFNKDAPQPWFNPAASFNVSVTARGKEIFSYVFGLLTIDHPTKNVQLEGHASSEKPANKPDYNKDLSQRRVQLIFDELKKKGVDESRFKDKKDSGCDKLGDGLKNCSDTESAKTTDANDRKVVARVF